MSGTYVVTAAPTPATEQLSLALNTLSGSRHAVTRDNRLDDQKRAALLTQIAQANLNPAQLEAVRHGEGPMLVLAGAGSGKTRVVTYRIAELIGLGYKPRKILAVTFTNKARDEMADRCEKILSPYTHGRPTTLTLHALGLRIARQHAQILGYKNEVQIVSDIDQDKFLEQALTKAPADVLAQRNPLEELRARIGVLKNNLIGPRQALEQGEPIAKAYETYQRALHRASLVDFDDLLRLPIGIFNDPAHGAALLQEWRKKFDFVLVDEYQDTNRAQFELLKLLAGEHKNLFVVGDDDQSIYGWRAADVSLIRDFETHWPGAKKVTLDINYRSTQPILDLGNTLMQNEAGRHQKNLRAHNGGGSAPSVTAHSHEDDEAAWIAKTISESQGSPGSFAILVRNQYRMEPITKALAHAKIPYELWTKDRTRMGETKRNVYSMFAAIHSPEKVEAPYLQLLENSAFALPAADFETLIARQDESDRPLWEIMNSPDVRLLSPDGQKQLENFCGVIQRLHAQAHIPGKRPELGAIARYALRELYPEAASDEAWQKTDSELDDASSATPALKKIVDYVHAYETRTLRPTFSAYLGHLERIRRKAKEPHRNGSSEQETPAVIVSTFHAAKGLEFPHVFMPALTNGTIPSKQSLALESENPAALAEERRLFYVGITRAQQHLSLSFSVRTRQGNPAVSQYLNECGALQLLDSSNLAAGATPA